MVNDLNCYYRNAGTAALGLKDKAFRQNLPSKTYLPKACNFHVQMPGSLNGGRSMPGKCLRDVALGQLAGCEMGLTLEREEGALGQLAGCEMGSTLESEEGEVPHLRWSQAPPLPWPRPGSADLRC